MALKIRGPAVRKQVAQLLATAAQRVVRRSGERRRLRQDAASKPVGRARIAASGRGRTRMALKIRGPAVRKQVGQLLATAAQRVVRRSGERRRLRQDAASKPVGRARIAASGRGRDSNGLENPGACRAKAGRPAAGYGRSKSCPTLRRKETLAPGCGLKTGRASADRRERQGQDSNGLENPGACRAKAGRPAAGYGRSKSCPTLRRKETLAPGCGLKTGRASADRRERQGQDSNGLENPGACRAKAGWPAAGYGRSKVFDAPAKRDTCARMRPQNRAGERGSPRAAGERIPILSGLEAVRNTGSSPFGPPQVPADEGSPL